MNPTHWLISTQVPPPTERERAAALAFSGAPALTAVCMTYGNEANARKALGVLGAVAAVTTARVMPELVLLFNPLSGDSYAPPPSFVEELGPRGRLVVAPSNTLLNRFNMTIIRPKTDGILLIDDDDAVLSAENYEALLTAFATTRGRRVLAGGGHTRSPVTMARRVPGRVTDGAGGVQPKRGSLKRNS